MDSYRFRSDSRCTQFQIPACAITDTCRCVLSLGSWDLLHSRHINNLGLTLGRDPVSLFDCSGQSVGESYRLSR
jgi:hypothetical protein